MKYKARLLSLVLFLSCLALSLNAQERKGREEHIEKFRAMRIAYFSERLELSPVEAEKFWPLYNEHEKEKHEFSPNRQFRGKNRNQQLEKLSDQEVEEIIDRMIVHKIKEAQLAEEFHKELKKILPPKKIMKLYITEIHFREYILRRIRDERGGDPKGKGKNPAPASLLP